jgi:hypothetical protein
VDDSENPIRHRPLEKRYLEAKPDLTGIEAEERDVTTRKQALVLSALAVR